MHFLRERFNKNQSLSVIGRTLSSRKLSVENYVLFWQKYRFNNAVFFSNIYSDVVDLKSQVKSA